MSYDADYHYNRRKIRRTVKEAWQSIESEAEKRFQEHVKYLQDHVHDVIEAGETSHSSAATASNFCQERDDDVSVGIVLDEKVLGDVGDENERTVCENHGGESLSNGRDRDEQECERNDFETQLEENAGVFSDSDDVSDYSSDCPEINDENLIFRWIN